MKVFKMFGWAVLIGVLVTFIAGYITQGESGIRGLSWFLSVFEDAPTVDFSVGAIRNYQFSFGTAFSWLERPLEIVCNALAFLVFLSETIVNALIFVVHLAKAVFIA